MWYKKRKHEEALTHNMLPQEDDCQQCAEWNGFLKPCGDCLHRKELMLGTVSRRLSQHCKIKTQTEIIGMTHLDINS